MGTRRNFLRNAGLTFAVAARTAIDGTALNILSHSLGFDINDLQIIQYDVVKPYLPSTFKITFAMISDLHAGSPGVTPDALTEIVNIVNGLKPDVIALVGDLQVAKHYDPRTDFLSPEPIAERLSQLKASKGVFATKGNHDNDRDKQNRANASRIYQQHGIQMLDNTSVDIDCGGHTLKLLGLPDDSTGWKDFKKTNYPNLNHEPVAIISHDSITAERYMPPEAIVQFSGHYHGGQYVDPVLNRPYKLPRDDVPKDLILGRTMRNNADIIIGPGIGTSNFTARNIPPAIVLTTIRGLNA